MSTLKLSVQDADLEKIIFEVKSQGHFDAFRKECLADVDTQPAFQNLHSRVEDSVQKFLNRQVWTPETNKNRLREDMRHSIVRAGYLESGVSRIVDQVVEQKMDLIQSKVEEILYKKILGIEKPVKKEKQPNGALEVETDLLPTDLEQVSPDSDKKSNLSSEEIRDEEVEEEIVEDEDFESPAFEPVEAMAVDKNETSQHSNLSAISGLTSQDSVENKSSEPTSAVPQQDTQLSQISSAQDLSEETPEETAILAGEDAQMAMDLSGQPEEKVEKSQFDLKKDSIEFTGTERKSIQLDDSTNSGEAEKVLQPQDVPSNTMEIDNLYENDTTDSSEMRMEIDLKDETTQETAGSSKVEESSQDSTVSKDKQPKEPLPHSKQDPPKDKHKSSSHKSSSRHHHSSSSSKSRHDDKHKSRSGGKSSSSGQKKSSGEKERSSSCRRDHDKDRKSTKDDPARSKHRDHKTTDDHHQEKSASRRRRSTDHDSNDGKAVQGKLKDVAAPAGDKASTTDQKPAGVDKSLNESGESKSSTSSSAKKEQKSSILVKYDYLKSSGSKRVDGDVSEDECHGFDDEELPNNPWIELLRKEAEKAQQKKPNRRASINNCLEQKKLDTSLKAKGKAKANSPDSSTAQLNGTEETALETRAQTIAQQQRYTDEDLYKPRFDFGNRSRRRGQVTEEIAGGAKAEKMEEVSG